MRLVKISPTEEDYKKYVLCQTQDISTFTKTQLLYIEIMKKINSWKYALIDPNNTKIEKSTSLKLPLVFNTKINKCTFFIKIVYHPILKLNLLFANMALNINNLVHFSTLKSILLQIEQNEIDVVKNLRMMKEIYLSPLHYNNSFIMSQHNPSSYTILKAPKKTIRFNGFRQINLRGDYIRIKSNSKDIENFTKNFYLTTIHLDSDKDLNWMSKKQILNQIQKQNDNFISRLIKQCNDLKNNLF